MGWVAAARVEVLSVAVPLLSVLVPIEVPLSLNVTDPVAAVGVTVAVKVTQSPCVDGFKPEITEVVVLVLFTVCVKVDEVLVL